MKIGNYQFEWYKIPTIKTKGTLKGSLVSKKLNCSEVKVADGYYDLISKDDMQKVLSLNRFVNDKNYSYISRKRDCDDYSFALMGMMRKLLPGVLFGIVWVDAKDYKGNLLYKHALNFFITDDLTTYFVEPQTNKIFLPTTTRFEPYFAIL